MANEKHLSILRQGVIAWNQWRKDDPEDRPDLSSANLSGQHLCIAYPPRPEELGEAITRVMYLIGVDFSGADLHGANLSATDLQQADFTYADLSNADLSNAYLLDTNFSSCRLKESNLQRAHVGRSTFGNVDLSQTVGLDTITHYSPSIIGVDTLYRSGGQISEAFLRGCGVPDDFVTYLPSIIGAEQAVQFYSCFISYSHKDEEFAERLHARLRAEQIRVWFAPEDIKGGEKLHEQIDRAIQIYDRLLLVLSDNSLQSEWVMSEIRRARKVEIKEKRQKLFPIRLVDFGRIREWECFDADSGKDLAIEVREYFIPDFSNWKDHDAFEAAFHKLLKDLRAAQSVSGV